MGPILKKTKGLALLLTTAMILPACADLQAWVDDSVGKIPTQVQVPFDVNQYKLNQVVCDPMGGSGNPGPQDGLIAELFYSQERYQSSQEYIDKGTASSQKLFFTELNIPTRLFSEGFPVETGGIVQDDNGDDLLEDFGLRFKSVIRLGGDDPEGYYELALLSDDGAVMSFTDAEGVEQVVVDNDGLHPTRMGCGDTVWFDHDTSYDVKIDYYQGPRYHISLIPIWRLVDDQTAAEKECGKKGNSRYFDFNNNSQPKQNYLDLLLRGWKPIAAENWHLPPMAIFNPCVQGTNPQITDFQVIDIGEGIAILQWKTELPATSQVLVRDSQGNEFVTESDNILRKDHEIVLDAEIRFGETYTFQAISISADMGKSLSRVLQETF